MIICSQPQCQTTAGCVCQLGMTVMDHAKLARIAELERALRVCMEWAGSDCEHPACKGVIETAQRALLQR